MAAEAMLKEVVLEPVGKQQEQTLIQRSTLRRQQVQEVHIPLTGTQQVHETLIHPIAAQQVHETLIPPIAAQQVQETITDPLHLVIVATVHPEAHHLLKGGVAEDEICNNKRCTRVEYLILPFLYLHI